MKEEDNKVPGSLQGGDDPAKDHSSNDQHEERRNAEEQRESFAEHEHEHDTESKDGRGEYSEPVQDGLQEEQPAASAAKPNKAAAVWMGVSFVLLVLLIVVAVTGPLSGKASNDVVAVVNGVEINKNTLYESMVEAGGANAVENLITEELLRQEATKAGITVTDADVDAEWAKLEKQYGSKEQLLNLASQSGFTEQALRKQMYHQVELRKLLEPTIDVSEDKVKEFYETNKQYMTTPLEVKASHILVATEDEAKAILQQLKDGADFATLAKEKSTDPGSKDNGGDLGFFGTGMMVPEFEQAAFALKVGELSDIVKTQHGYHIIKVTERKEESTPTYEEKKDELTEQLKDQEVYQKSGQWLEELKAKSAIENKLKETPEKSTESNPSSDEAKTEQEPAKTE